MTGEEAPLSGVEGELIRRRQRGEAVVLGTVVRIDGAPPSRPGEKILLNRSSALAGTLGCSEFDSAARGDAAGVIESGRPAIRQYQHELGSIEVFLEPHAEAIELVVLGDSPVASELLELAGRLGWRTSRRVTTPSPDAFVVHTDHEDPQLVDQLEPVLRSGARFVGVMGSRRHTGHHLEELVRRGIPASVVGRIQSPVGLDIGARSAAEIALSIMAGLVAIRHGAEGGWKSGGAGAGSAPGQA